MVVRARNMRHHTSFLLRLASVGLLLYGTESKDNRGNKLEQASTKINRGFTARRGEYLYAVWIQTGGKKFQCGGSLVSEEWVLTAAQCVKDRVVENYKMYIGDYRPRREDGEIIVDPDKIVLHPEYTDGLSENDIALVHLSTKIDLENTAITAMSQLYNGSMTNDTLNRNRCLICGWGKKRNGKLNKRKQFLPINVASDGQCGSNYNTYSNKTSLCYTGDPGGPCQDVGAPIVCLIEDKWTQIGIHTDDSCTTGYHVAAKISAVQSWIDAVVQGLDCPTLPSIANGTFVELDGGNGNDKLAVLVCYSGFSPSNQSDIIIVCEDNNQWSNISVTCVEDAQGCDVTPTVANGVFTKFNDTDGKTRAILECETDYEPSSDDVIITCIDDEQWSTIDTICVRTPQDCPALPLIENGRFIQVDIGDGRLRAFLVCNTDYEPSSNDTTIVCSSGQWSSVDVTCVRTDQDCPAPPTVTKGQYIEFEGSDGKLRAVLTCDTGYSPSSDDITIVCETDGQWSTSSVTCVRDPDDCSDPPDIENGQFVRFEDNDGTVKAVLVCDYDFSPSSGDITIVCEDNGQWSDTSVMCIRDSQDCPAPPTIVKGKFVEIDVGDVRTAILVCDSGFSPSSQSGTIIECRSTGQWTSTNVTCIQDPKDCPDPPTVDYGKFVEFTGSDGKQRAVLVCDSGSSPSSDRTTIVCQESGEWNTTGVTCVRDTGGCSSKGTSFMLGFPRNYNGAGVPYLYTITSEPVTVTVTIPYYTSSPTVSFYFVSAAIWYFDHRIFGDRHEEVAAKGIQVQSTKPITVFAHQYEHGNGPSADGTLVLPEACASSEYIVVSHNKSPSSAYKSNIMIIGINDQTTVDLQLRNGHQRQVTLGRYGTYHYSTNDLSGAVVRASAKVVVMAGHECANVPNNNIGKCDHLLEQLPPLSSLQNTYILTYMKPRPNYSLRIVAPYSNTVVYIWDRLGKLLETVYLSSTSKTYFNYALNSQTISITANKGILVAQYGHGTYSDNLGYGDPSMVIHPSLDQFVNSYHLFCPTDFYSINWVAIIIKGSHKTAGLRLNNKRISGYQYISVNVPGNGSYKVIHVQLYGQVNYLSHTDSNVKFGAMQYGFNTKVEYSWIAGRLV